MPTADGRLRRARQRMRCNNLCHPNFTYLTSTTSPTMCSRGQISLIESFRLATNPKSLEFEYFVNVIQYDFLDRMSIPYHMDCRNGVNNACVPQTCFYLRSLNDLSAFTDSGRST